MFPLFKSLSIFSKFSIMSKRYGASLVPQRVKDLPAVQETWVWSLGSRRCSGEGEWLPAPMFLPGEFYEQRSLVSYGLQGRKESEMTEQLTCTYIIIHCCLKCNGPCLLTSWSCLYLLQPGLCPLCHLPTCLCWNSCTHSANAYWILGTGGAAETKTERPLSASVLPEGPFSHQTEWPPPRPSPQFLCDAPYTESPCPI